MSYYCSYGNKCHKNRWEEFPHDKTGNRAGGESLQDGKLSAFIFVVIVLVA